MPVPEQPEFPACAEHVWKYWQELDGQRPSGFDSLSPLGWTEIKSWSELTGTQLSPDDSRLIVRMDKAWIAAIAKERKAKQERDSEKS